MSAGKFGAAKTLMNLADRTMLCIAFATFGTCARAAVCPVDATQPNLSVRGHPFAVAAPADSCWLFVSLSDGSHSGSIAVLKNVGGIYQSDHIVRLRSGAFGLALSPDEQTLYVAAWSGIAVLDVQQLESGGAASFLGTMATGSNAGTLYTLVSGDGNLLFASNENSNSLSVFDLLHPGTGSNRFGTLIGRIPTAGAPVGMAFSADARWLYVTNEIGPHLPGSKDTCAAEDHKGRNHARGLLVRIDMAKAGTEPDHAVNSAVVAGCNPVRVAVSASGGQIWVTARGDGAVLRFTVADESSAIATQVHPISVGPSPVGIAVRPDDTQVWIAQSDRFHHGNGSLVGLIDPGADDPSTKRASVTATGFPRELRFLADGRTLVATLFDAEQIQFAQTPP